MNTYVIADVQKAWVGGKICFGKKRKKNVDIKSDGIYGHKLKSSNVAVTLVKEGLHDFCMDFDKPGKVVVITPIVTKKRTMGKIGRFDFIEK